MYILEFDARKHEPNQESTVFWSEKALRKEATMAVARIGIGISGLVLLAGSPSVQGANWSLVAPRSNTLPSGEPPSSFDRRENIVSPLGVSSGLNNRPALLHTNKFYSNLLVSGCFASLCLIVDPCCHAGAVIS